MSTQPEALRLAYALETGRYLLSVERDATAAELRRLHTENESLHQRHHDDNVEYTRVLAQRDALLEALKHVRAVLPHERWADDTKKMVDAAIAKAEEQE